MTQSVTRPSKADVVATRIKDGVGVAVGVVAHAANTKKYRREMARLTTEHAQKQPARTNCGAVNRKDRQGMAG